MGNKRAGRIELKVDGEILDAKGNFEYNLGIDMRESMVGADRIHGFKETPQVAFISGEITDAAILSHSKLAATDGATVTLRLGNDKTIILNEAYAAGEWGGGTEEANIAFRFESALPAEEMRAI